MSLQIDPEVLAGLAALGAQPEPPPVGDVETRRESATLMFERLAGGRPAAPGITVREFSASADDGTGVPLRWYQSTDSAQPGSAVVYLHGGGMIFGLTELGALYDAGLRGYVAASGVPMLVVDYRVAPEFADPVPLGDCYTGLRWLAEHAEELGVDPRRVAVMGDSAGGGLAAGVALMARDRGGPSIAAQLLIYPMLDDRTVVAEPRLLPFLTWTYDDNATGWGALLGGRAAGGYAAPARAQDLSGLPPSYIEVGDLDIFYDEDLSYASRLAHAEVVTELHVHPGCPHAFDALAPDADVTQRAMADRVRRLRAL
jgi:acetyl esterase/lipase